MQRVEEDEEAAAALVAQTKAEAGRLAAEKAAAEAEAKRRADEEAQRVAAAERHTRSSEAPRALRRLAKLILDPNSHTWQSARLLATAATLPLHAHRNDRSILVIKLATGQLKPRSRPLQMSDDELMANLDDFINEPYDDIELEPVPPNDTKKETIH